LTFVTASVTSLSSRSPRAPFRKASLKSGARCGPRGRICTPLPGNPDTARPALRPVCESSLHWRMGNADSSASGHRPRKRGPELEADWQQSCRTAKPQVERRKAGAPRIGALPRRRRQVATLVGVARGIGRCAFRRSAPSAFPLGAQRVRRGVAKPGRGMCVAGTLLLIRPRVVKRSGGGQPRSSRGGGGLQRWGKPLADAPSTAPAGRSRSLVSRGG